MTVHGIGREERERERERRKSLSSSFHGKMHIYEAIIICYTRTHTHTRHSSKVENNESEICKFKRQYQCVCVQNGWSV